MFVVCVQPEDALLLGPAQQCDSLSVCCCRDNQVCGWGQNMTIPPYMNHQAYTSMPVLED